jgi:methionyl-tRNA formyltransferase
MGGRLMVEALELAACGGLNPTSQPTEGITYAHKIDKAESAVDWKKDAAQIERTTRAFAPSPACSGLLRGEVIKLCSAQAFDADHYQKMSATGSIFADEGTILLANETGIDVQCGANSVLRITELQRPGGKRLTTAEFLRGFAMQVGERFESAA